MSEQTQSNNQQIIVIGMIVIAALLAAIVGVLIYQQTRAIPPTSASPTTSTPQTTGTNTGQQPAATPADFDPKTATKVPKGTEPDAYVQAYYKACEDGDWQAAFDALPADKKTGSSPDALKQQVTGYGIKSFSVGKATVTGDKASVKADQVTGSYGTFENTWTFVKKDGVWLVESKAVTGMK